MKKRRAFPSLLLLAVLAWFLLCAAQVREGALYALILCAKTLVPALFPLLVVTSLLLSLGADALFAPLLSPLAALFALPPAAASALLLGAAGGYPIGARTAAQLCQAGALTKSDAERLLGFCNLASPAYLVSVLGAGVFGGVRIGFWLWGIHLAAAVLTGLLLSLGRRGERFSSFPSAANAAPPSFAAAFVSAVSGAAETMLCLCAFTVFFSVLVSPLASRGLSLAVGLTELTSLTPLLTADARGFVLAAACAGWGGVCVLFQSAAAIEGSGLSLRALFFGKLLHGALSSLLAAACAMLIFA